MLLALSCQSCPLAPLARIQSVLKYLDSKYELLPAFIFALESFAVALLVEFSLLLTDITDDSKPSAFSEVE
jgi:hypothetical protein